MLLRNTVWPGWQRLWSTAVARPVAFHAENRPPVENERSLVLVDAFGCSVPICVFHDYSGVVGVPIGGGDSSKDVAKNLRPALEANGKLRSVERKEIFGADSLL